MRICFIISCIISLLGISLGRIYHFPLSIDVSLAVILFLWFGDFMKRYSFPLNFIRFVISLGFWIVLWYIINQNSNWGLEIAGRSYPLFPLCFLEGIAGTIVLVYMSDLISKHQSPFTNELARYGQLSFVILIIHCLDFLWKDYYSLSQYAELNAALRITIDLTIFYIYIIVKYMYKNRLSICRS